MSPMILGITTAALLIGLIALYSMMQAVQTRREEKQRVVNMLLARAEHFQELLSAFPPGFLPQDLRQLVGSSLVDAWRHLRNMDPKNRRYQDEEQQCSQQLLALGKENTGSRAVLDNPATIKEARNHLKNVGQYLQQQTANGKLSAQQARHFTLQLHQLHIQISLDSYNLAIRQSNASKQYSLAAHHCEQARKLLLKENNPNHAVLLEHYEQLHEQCLHKAELLASGIDPEAMAAPAEPQDTPAARPPETPPPAAREPAAESSPKKKISLGAKRQDYD